MFCSEKTRDLLRFLHREFQLNKNVSVSYQLIQDWKLGGRHSDGVVACCLKELEKSGVRLVWATVSPCVNFSHVVIGSLPKLRELAARVTHES